MTFSRRDEYDKALAENAVMQDRVTRADAAMENEALITRDQAYEIERLRAALQQIMRDDERCSHPCWPKEYGHFGRIAQTALASQQNGDTSK